MENLKQFLKNNELNPEELDEATTKALNEVLIMMIQRLNK